MLDPLNQVTPKTYNGTIRKSYWKVPPIEPLLFTSPFEKVRISMKMLHQGNNSTELDANRHSLLQCPMIHFGPAFSITPENLRKATKGTGEFVHLPRHLAIENNFTRRIESNVFKTSHYSLRMMTLLAYTDVGIYNSNTALQIGRTIVLKTTHNISPKYANGDIYTQSVEVFLKNIRPARARKMIT